MARALVLEDLIVWQLACELEGAVLDLVRRTPQAGRDFRFASQLNAAASSVPSNVTEGFHRFKAGEFAQFLRYARASLAEVEKRLHTGVRMGYFSPADIAPILQLARRLGKALTNFHDYLKARANRR